MDPVRSEPHPSWTHLTSSKVKKTITHPTAVVKTEGKEITMLALSAYPTDRDGVGGATGGIVRVV